MSELVISRVIRITCEFFAPSTGTQPSLIYNLFFLSYKPVLIRSAQLTGTDTHKIHWHEHGFTIRGELKSIADPNEMILTGDLYYGKDSNVALQSHFDGTIFLYRFDDDAPQPVLPDNEDDATDNDIPETMSVDTPLFPYVAIQKWQSQDPPGTLLSFFTYDPSKTPAHSLYDQLIKAKPDANKMQALVKDFLMPTDPAKVQYFFELKNIPEPFRDLPLVYDSLKKDLCWLTDREQIVIDAVILDQLWQNYFALVIAAGYNEHLFNAISKILILCNLLDRSNELPEHDLKLLLDASIVLPGDLFPLPDQKIPEPVQSGNVSAYAIGQLKMTRYRLLKYQQGEVAHIQNVLKGERKKVVNRSLTSEAQQSKEQNISDNASHELLVEVSKTLADVQKTITFGNDKTPLTTTYGPPTQALWQGTYTEQIIHDTKDPGTYFAKNILNKTINRINESVLKSRSFLKYSEQEEISSSMFDNREGPNLRGIYRWVNKVYRISVENYGYRFLLQLKIADPASHFIASQQGLNDVSFKRPLSPQDKNINGPDDIKPDNYAALLAYYRITQLMLPPQETAVASAALNGDETERIITIPEGYTATTATVTATGSDKTVIVTGLVSAQPFSLNLQTSVKLTLQNETGQVMVSIVPQTSPLVVTVVVNCTISDAKTIEWKFKVFNAITEAYEKMLADYDMRLSRFAGRGVQSDPLLLNHIQTSSLHAGCMDLLTSVSSETTGPMLQGFLREALEWEEMTYSFDAHLSGFSYPLQGYDDSLRPFLQAKSATVWLPVRPFFNFSVLYFLSSGMCMEPGAFVPVNAVDLPVAKELKRITHWHNRSEQERCWEIVMPTNMQVIQESAQLPVFHH